jgi:hypothetical protein
MSPLAIAQIASVQIGLKMGLGIGLGALPLLLNRDPWGTESDPSRAGADATLSAIGAAGNGSTAYLAGTYATAGATAATIGIAAAAIGGIEIGRAFNQAWTYFSHGNSSFGTWWYDSTHPGK